MFQIEELNEDLTTKEEPKLEPCGSKMNIYDRMCKRNEKGQLIEVKQCVTGFYKCGGTDEKPKCCIQGEAYIPTNKEKKDIQLLTTEQKEKLKRCNKKTCPEDMPYFHKQKILPIPTNELPDVKLGPRDTIEVPSIGKGKIVTIEKPEMTKQTKIMMSIGAAIVLVLLLRR